MLAGPSRWGQAPGRSTAHGHCLAGPVDPVRIPPLALDPYLVEQRYHRQHLRIFGVSNFVILDACLRPDHCWGVLAGLWGLEGRARRVDARFMLGARPGRPAPAAPSNCKSTPICYLVSLSRGTDPPGRPSTESVSGMHPK